MSERTTFTRDQLHRRLQAFEANLPFLIEANPHPAEFRDALQAFANLILRDASAADHDWVLTEMDGVLRGQRMPPLDREALSPL